MYIFASLSLSLSLGKIVMMFITVFVQFACWRTQKKKREVKKHPGFLL